MERKTLSLGTNNDKFFRQFLEVMNFIVKITPQERDVLAELIRLDFEYEALPQDKRTRFILSTDSRKEICTKINLKDKQFNVILSNLKQKEFKGISLLDVNNYIHPELKVRPDDEGFMFQVIFVNQKVEIQPIQQIKEVKPVEVVETNTVVEVQEDTPVSTTDFNVEVISKNGTVGDIIEEPKIEFNLIVP